jgi:transposase, IS5 family
VRCEDFRADIEAVTETKPDERRSNAGRKPTTQSLNSGSLCSSEFLIRDRLSFMRSTWVLRTLVPDANDHLLFREALAEAGLIEKLFGRFGQHLGAKGYIAAWRPDRRCQHRIGAQAAQQAGRERRRDGKGERL